MKILFAIKSIRYKGGAERVCCDIANELVCRKHDVTILTFDDHHCQPTYPINNAVKKHYLGIGITENKTSRFTCFFKL